MDGVNIALMQIYVPTGLFMELRWQFFQLSGTRCNFNFRCCVSLGYCLFLTDLAFVYSKILQMNPRRD